MSNQLQKLIELFPDELWDWDEISRNPNINLDFVKKHIDKPWCYHNLTLNFSISIEEINGNKYIPWELNLTSWKDVIKKRHSRKKIYKIDQSPGCVYWVVSKKERKNTNPHITWQMVCQNKLHWDFKILSSNLFEKHKNFRSIPFISEKRKYFISILQQEYFGIPPGIDSRPIFKSGGPWFHESWENIKELRQIPNN